MCGTITVDADQEVGIGIFVLRGESTNGEMKPLTEGDLEWVSRNELSHFPLVEDLYTLLPRVLSTEKSDSPFSAHYSYDGDGQLMINFSN